MGLIFFFAFILGMFVGMTIDRMGWFKSSGVLYIDRSNPDRDLYRLEIDELESLNDKTRVVLTIEHDVILSQE